MTSTPFFFFFLVCRCRMCKKSPGATKWLWAGRTSYEGGTRHRALWLLNSQLIFGQRWTRKDWHRPRHHRTSAAYGSTSRRFVLIFVILVCTVQETRISLWLFNSKEIDLVHFWYVKAIISMKLRCLVQFLNQASLLLNRNWSEDSSCCSAGSADDRIHTVW